MSNFLNSYYSDLNGLVSIQAIDITTDSLLLKDITVGNIFLSTNTLKNIRFLSNVTSDVQQQIDNISSVGYVTQSSLNDTLLNYVSNTSLQTQLLNYATFNDLQITNADISDLQTILTGAAYDSIFNFLNLSNNLHVFGSAIIEYAGQSYNIGDSCSRIGTMGYYSPSDFSTFNNIYCAGAIEYDNNGVHTNCVPLLKSLTANGYVDLVSSQTIVGLKTFQSGPIMSGLNISSQTIPINSIIGTALALSGTQTVIGTKTFSVQQNFSSNIRLDGSLLINSGGLTISNSTLQKLVYISGLTSDIQGQINTLSTKLTNVSFSTPKTSISGTCETNTLTFTNTLNGISSTTFSYLDASSSIQNQFEYIYPILSTVSSSAITSASTLAYLTLTKIPEMDTFIAGNTANIILHGGRLDNLESKTQKISYSSATNKTTITNTTQLSSLQFVNLSSGFIQDTNSACEFIGTVKIKNQLSVVSGFGFDVSGSISQTNSTSSNSFAGSCDMGNGLTISGSNTNIKTTNLNIGSNTIVKNTSTTSSGTISPYVSILSIATNTNAKKLQGIVIGQEQTLNNQCNANVGYNYVSDDSVNNYGYVGLNVNTLNTIESLRWSSSGVVIPQGSLTLSSGALKTNIINNQSTNLQIASTNSIIMDSNTVNIGINQGIAALNTINIGSVLSGTSINLNGLVYAPLGLNMTGIGSIFAQW